MVGILTSLDAVRQADRLIDSMRLADDLAFEASRDGGPRTLRVLTSVLDEPDQLVAIAAIHALAQVYDTEADRILSGLLSDPRPFIREHAAAGLAVRLPQYDSIGRLMSLVVDGGFCGMLAERTLERWVATSHDHIAIAAESALLGIRDPEPRARVVEILGLVRKRIAVRPLLTIAQDASEPEVVRAAAVSALGQRHGHPEILAVLSSLVHGDDLLSDVARLALVDLAPSPPIRPTDELTIAQLFLNADIDPGLEQAGRGDNGGIATLLVRLGDALITGSEARVGRVITMSRGSASDALDSVASIGSGQTGHLYGRVPLLTDPVQSAGAWPLRVTVRRGIRRLLRAAGHVDVLHLRMADVGSLAAADVARELDIPVVFTVAPDPHAVINSLDQSESLTHDNFGEVDEAEHFWFRGRLVQQLAANASHTVLFPRPELKRDMRELLGIDIKAHPERHTIVPEGIDIEVVDAAVSEAADYAAGLPASAPLAELAALVERLPAERRGLPLIVSVGRFHRVKGMATIVAAWANSPLRDRANLLLIGGDLANPSADEQQQLDLIDALIPSDQRFEQGLVLAGHQKNDTTARWVAAVRFGIPNLVAPRGIYVCGSLKEEFGIALLEAMATGLLVVAPDGGGPATYVEHEVTGFLAPTWHVDLLAAAMSEALAVSVDEGDAKRAAKSRRTVERSFTIQSMAKSLTSVYARVHDEEAELRVWPVGAG